MGQLEDGSDSIAEQVVDEKHWPEVEVLILVVCAEKKKVASTAGMQETVKTCPGIEVIYQCNLVTTEIIYTVS